MIHIFNLFTLFDFLKPYHDSYIKYLWSTLELYRTSFFRITGR